MRTIRLILALLHDITPSPHHWGLGPGLMGLVGRHITWKLSEIKSEEIAAQGDFEVLQGTVALLVSGYMQRY